jgi:hypothetical protein
MTNLEYEFIASQHDAHARCCCCWLICRAIFAPNVNKYYVTIEPGVDAAFIVALALLSDEIFHDDNK